MALSSTVEWDEEVVAGHDGTILSALRLIVEKKGPLTYNAFQSVFFSLKRQNYEDDPWKEEESQAEVQKRIHYLHGELNEEIHGEDWKTQSLKNPASRIRSSVSGTSAPVAHEPASKALPKAKPLIRDIYAEELALEDGEVGEAPVMKEVYVGTPRRPEQDQQSSTHGSPDAAMNDPEAYQMWLDCAETHTEATQEAQDRVTNMTERMAALDVMNQETLQFMVGGYRADS